MISLDIVRSKILPTNFTTSTNSLTSNLICRILHNKLNTIPFLWINITVSWNNKSLISNFIIQITIWQVTLKHQTIIDVLSVVFLRTRRLHFIFIFRLNQNWYFIIFLISIIRNTRFKLLYNILIFWIFSMLQSKYMYSHIYTPMINNDVLTIFTNDNPWSMSSIIIILFIVNQINLLQIIYIIGSYIMKKGSTNLFRELIYNKRSSSCMDSVQFIKWKCRIENPLKLCKEFLAVTDHPNATVTGHPT